MFGSPKTKDLTAHQVKAALDAEKILLVDVREPAEFAAERIPGAVNFPMSSFDPKALPDAGGKAVVFSCGSGKRSAAAVGHCQKVGQALDTHLTGGIMAWKAAGLPTVR
ncbi:sulfurtransferase [Caulobacter sp. Root1455]|jgi:rhodanese-related sulfurtransferase|uniref:rhodanese-like domain-containing protein n=1 Tax=unclassified Caulobacter TaxID=2648921 RepID=UPI00070100A2|nr:MULTISPECIES: rhodanese-like domain-containing protein [unclassified Caulobacter]KQY26422.1 sulfurtransferase [Caulobacter sp. Root487D2Y]KQY91402.1 sulfurtransferase [Caulobacter sp. Root1455]